MATVTSITGAVRGGPKSWEKSITDMNNIDETFANARDLGYVRLNHSRLTVVGKLASKYDSVDIYKAQVQSNGKLAISLRDTSGSSEKVLDLSKYEEALSDLKKITDPEGWAKEQAAKREEEANQDLLKLTAEGLTLQVYTVKNGKEVLVGDSSAEKGTKTRDALDKMIQGEYRAQKGEYYFKITRNDDVERNEEVPYAMQISMGDSYKHDYVATEQVSSDTKNKKESRIPLTQSDSTTGSLSAVNALQIQATRYQATAQMLQVGYLNMASIYNKNNNF